MKHFKAKSQKDADANIFITGALKAMGKSDEEIKEFIENAAATDATNNKGKSNNQRKILGK